MDEETAQDVINKNIDLLFSGRCNLVAEKDGEKLDVSTLLRYILLETKLVTAIEPKTKRVRDE